MHVILAPSLHGASTDVAKYMFIIAFTESDALLLYFIYICTIGASTITAFIYMHSPSLYTD